MAIVTKIVLPELVFAVAASLSGCSAFDSPTSPGAAERRAVDSSRESSGEDATRSPRACTEHEVATLVKRFMRAFNRGDMDVLDRLFATELEFEWYSTDAPGERFNENAYDRSTLVRYFGARHARGERLLLRRFRFNGNAHGTGGAYGNFQYSLVRSADGLAPTRYHGKGAARCYDDANVIFVWSMGREASE